ncbi:MAG: hypothetical protein ACREVC_03490 [Burkholderiales bacterium]
MRLGRNLLEALGPLGVFGIGLLLACLPFYFSAIRPTEQELAQQRIATERLPARAPTRAVAAESPAQRLQRFERLFPPLARLPDELERLYGLAHDAHLDLARGDYRLEDDGGPLLEYRVTLPLHGTYPVIRQFVAQVLHSMPVVSVDALQFERDGARAQLLNAQVRLTVYFRSSGRSEAR